MPSEDERPTLLPLPAGSDEAQSDAVQETRALLKTLTAFALYRPSMHAVIQRKRQDFLSLSQHHRQLLPNFLHKFERADVAIAGNADLAEDLLRASSASMLGAMWHPSYKVQTSDSDVDRARVTLKQLLRDWSRDGAEERADSYDPMLAKLAECFKETPDLERNQVRVLTPGCGLGRLTYEVAQCGFHSTGNEFAYSMLACSNFVLNHIEQQEAYSVVSDPHVFSNRQSKEDLFYASRVPDVVPRETMQRAGVGELNMAMGDFIDSFSKPDSKSSFDAVLTCFFLDTAHNIVDYLEAILHCLKPGGYLINHGPLLWHHENMVGDRKPGQNAHGVASHNERSDFVGSIELDAEELLSLVKRIGFTVEHASQAKTTYMRNTNSLLSHEYNTLLFVARKPF